MNNTVRFALVLFLVNFIAASILAGVYYVTKPRIEQEKKFAEEQAMKEVMPISTDSRFEPVKDGGEIRYWKVFKDSAYKPTGYIFIAKKYGYSSIIETMVGMKIDGSITGVKVINQNETPGLGAKIVEVVSNSTVYKALKGLFSKQKEAKEKILPYFTEQFKGRDIRKIELSKDGIHAITGATISSRAVVEGIREKGLEILKYTK